MYAVLTTDQSIAVTLKHFFGNWNREKLFRINNFHNFLSLNSRMSRLCGTYIRVKPLCIRCPESSVLTEKTFSFRSCRDAPLMNRAVLSRLRTAEIRNNSGSRRTVLVLAHFQSAPCAEEPTLESMARLCDNEIYKVLHSQRLVAQPIPQNHTERIVRHIHAVRRCIFRFGESSLPEVQQDSRKPTKCILKSTYFKVGLGRYSLTIGV